MRQTWCFGFDLLKIYLIPVPFFEIHKKVDHSTLVYSNNESVSAKITKILYCTVYILYLLRNSKSDTYLIRCTHCTVQYFGHASKLQKRWSFQVQKLQWPKLKLIIFLVAKLFLLLQRTLTKKKMLNQICYIFCIAPKMGKIGLNLWKRKMIIFWVSFNKIKEGNARIQKQRKKQIFLLNLG